MTFAKFPIARADGAFRGTEFPRFPTSRIFLTLGRTCFIGFRSKQKQPSPKSPVRPPTCQLRPMLTFRKIGKKFSNDRQPVGLERALKAGCRPPLVRGKAEDDQICAVPDLIPGSGASAERRPIQATGEKTASLFRDAATETAFLALLHVEFLQTERRFMSCRWRPRSAMKRRDCATSPTSSSRA